SLRDLAAKMIRSGMNGGAVVNLLRAQMDGSSAPHDERWRERYDSIPRLVKGAEERFADERETQAKEQKPQPQPQPRPRTQEGGGQQTSAIDEVIAKFREWLLLKDITPLLALLGTVAANYLPGDPVWFGIIAPGSSAKTEMLNSVYGLPNIHKSGPM